MTIWVKPNGKDININDNKETVEYAESLGWKKKKPEEPKKKSKKKRKKIT